MKIAIATKRGLLGDQHVKLRKDRSGAWSWRVVYSGTVVCKSADKAGVAAFIEGWNEAALARMEKRAA